MDLPKTIYKFSELESIYSQLPGRRDGPADAYRHILAAAEAVRQGYPEGAVRSWGSYREWGDPSDRAAMDKHNNDVGIAIGREAASLDDLLRRVREAVSEGSTEFDDSLANWHPESEWGGNPMNDETKDQKDRLPTDKTNWPPQWPDGLSPEDPNWWRCNTANPLGDFNNPDANGNGVPDFMESQCGGLGGDAGDTASKGDGGSSSSIPHDPLVFDLDGDGVELTNLEGSTAYFDLNGDGFATRTSWLSSDDGFLALDRNEDGKINDISELFGSPERTGYDELGELDSNGDGVIDADDSRFAELKLWQDENGDGVSQADELRSLSEAGITSISLSHTTVSAQAGTDGQIARQGAFTWADGRQGITAETTGIAADVLFLSSPTFTQYVGDVEIDPDVLVVGNIKGYGQMPDLHIAMSLDSTLKAGVLTRFESATVTSLISGFEQLLTDWADVNDIEIDSIDPDHRLNVNTETGRVDFRLAGESFTLEQLGIIKQYTGIDVLSLGDGQWRENGEIVTTGGYYRQAYNELSRNLLVKFAVANGLLSDVMPGLSYNATTDLLTITTAINAQVFDDILARIAASVDDAEVISTQWLVLTAMVEIAPSYRSTLAEAIDKLVSSADDLDALLPVFDNQIFKFLDLDSNIGTPGADTIYGSDIRDVIIGFDGNDRLFGRGGDDTLYGNDDDDILYGEAGDDVLDGGTGRDRLYGGAGDDTLRGGAGENDYLSGGAGNDSYLFGSGDGSTTIYNHDADADRQDVLRFLTGIEAEDVRATRYSTHLLLTIQETVITVQNYFHQDGAGGYALNAIEFADGTRWDVDTIKEMVQQGSEGNDHLYGYAVDDTLNGLGGNDRLYGYAGDDTLSGGAGNDHLYGGAGNDSLRGGAGNDVLEGGAGNDSYLFGSGDGSTTIYNHDTDTGRNDVLRFLAGVEAEDVRATRYSTHLLLTIQETVITVQNYFHQDGAGGYALNAIEFADGTRWDVDSIKEMVQQGSEGNDYLYGYAVDDTLNGLGGNDRLYGYAGDDTLSGGAGNDHL